MVSTGKLLALIVLGATAMILAGTTVSLLVLLKQRKSMDQRKKKTVTQNETRKSGNPFASQDRPFHRQYGIDPSSPITASEGYFSESIGLFGEDYPLGDGGPKLKTRSAVDWERKKKGKSKREMRTMIVISLGGTEWKINIPSFILHWKKNWEKLWIKVKYFSGKFFFSFKKLSNSRNREKSNKDDNFRAAFYHLEKAASLGNPNAQQALAHVLTTGIFLGENPPENFSSVSINQTYALLLYHLAAISGNIESQMVLGYRHFASWQVDSNVDMDNLLGKETYGVYGTCKMALAYYEEAANGVIDEMEEGWGRGKVNPSMDGHKLHEMHMIGSGPLLADHNKPDDHSEALEYYRLRATSTHGELDIFAAHTLAHYHHHGVRGVDQDLAQALKYYEISADGGSPDAAGLAAFFHLYGIGYEDSQVENNQNEADLKLELHGDLDKAYKYSQMGAKNSLEGCSKRHYEKDQSEQNCSEDALNVLGVLHLLGVPNKVPKDVVIANDYFKLARDRGSADASYNLAMMKLGWLQNFEYADPEEFDAEVSAESNAESDVGKEQARKEDEKLYHEEKMVNNQGSDENFNDELRKTVNLDLSQEDIKTLTAYAERHQPLNMNENADVRDTISKLFGKGYSLISTNELQSIAEAAADGAKMKNTNSGLPEGVNYDTAIVGLTHAAKKNHLQAKHRLGMIYSRGISTKAVHDDPKSQSPFYILPNCPKAVGYFKEVADKGPMMARRLRKGHKQYTKGYANMALRNYLVAAEMGNLIAQLNAAWLLEQGHCLGMNKITCTKASLRLWRAAARQGNADASLKVGNYFYYNQFTEAETKENKGWFHKVWWNILFPEVMLKDTETFAVRWTEEFLSRKEKIIDNEQVVESKSCDANECSETCPAPDVTDQTNDLSATKINDIPKRKSTDNLSAAAKYYRHTADIHNNAQAHFNLGFMHEWGLGLKQDFPLAKRHYDLASSSSPEAHVAVMIALWSMNIHENVVKVLTMAKEWSS